MLRFVEWIKASEFAGYRCIVVHWRAIILLLILAATTFLIANGDFFYLILIALLLTFIGSQIFWVKRIIDLGERLIPGKPSRARIAIIVDLVYLFVIAYSFPTTLGQGHTFRLGFYRLSNIVAEAVFWWWFVGSILAFVLVLAFGLVDWVGRAASWTYWRARQVARGDVTKDSEAIASSPSRPKAYLKNINLDQLAAENPKALEALRIPDDADQRSGMMPITIPF